MAARSTTIVFKNMTEKETLLFPGDPSAPPGGEWDVAPYVETLPPKTITAWTTQSDGLATGTKNSLLLLLESDASKGVTVSWGNPYWGGNSYSGSAPTPYKLSWQGGVGNNAIVVFIFSD
jgi:hypothetical protein